MADPYWKIKAPPGSQEKSLDFIPALLPRRGGCAIIKPLP
jgi:hypothetical protein